MGEESALTLFQVMAGSGSPWELQGSCTLVPTSTVMSLGMLANTGVTRRQVWRMRQPNSYHRASEEQSVQRPAQEPCK